MTYDTLPTLAKNRLRTPNNGAYRDIVFHDDDQKVLATLVHIATKHQAVVQGIEALVAVDDKADAASAAEGLIAAMQAAGNRTQGIELVEDEDDLVVAPGRAIEDGPFSYVEYVDEAARRLWPYPDDWPRLREHVAARASYLAELGHIHNPREAATAAVIASLDDIYRTQVAEKLEQELPASWMTWLFGGVPEPSDRPHGFKSVFDHQDLGQLHRHFEGQVARIGDPVLTSRPNRMGLSVDPTAPPLSTMAASATLIRDTDGPVLLLESGRSACAELLSSLLPGRRVHARSTVHPRTRRDHRGRRLPRLRQVEAVVLGVPALDSVVYTHGMTRGVPDEEQGEAHIRTVSSREHEELLSFQAPREVVRKYVRFLLEGAIRGLQVGGILVTVVEPDLLEILHQIIPHHVFPQGRPITAFRVEVPSLPRGLVMPPSKCRVVRAYRRML